MMHMPANLCNQHFLQLAQDTLVAPTRANHQLSKSECVRTKEGMTMSHLIGYAACRVGPLRLRHHSVR